jgi:hypothetical protein
MSRLRIKRAFEKVFALTFFDILIVSTLVFPATANNVGVRVDDWAKYDINFEYTWVSDTEKEPSSLQEAKKRDWNNVTVIEVIGSAVRIKVVTHVNNGTEFTDTYFGDIMTGEGNFTFPMLIAANLSEGEPISIDPEVPPINKTMSMNFAGANRNVNFIPIFEGQVGWSSEAKRYVIQGNGSIYYFYFDQKTGFLCQFELLTKDLNASYVLLTHMNIVMRQTNLWVPETFSGWGWWLIGAAVIVVPAALFYFSRTRKKKHRRVASHLTKHR